MKMDIEESAQLYWGVCALIVGTFIVADFVKFSICYLFGI